MCIIRSYESPKLGAENCKPLIRLIMITGLWCVMGSAYAESYFNPAFLSPDIAAVADLSRFEQGKQQAGSYHVDIFVNDQFLMTKNIRFISSDINTNAGGNSGGLTPCFDKYWLNTLGVNTSAIQSIEQYADGQCLPLQHLIPASEINYDFAGHKLNLSFPQAWLINSARGYIPPSQWDNGIPAALMNYNLSSDKGTHGQSSFLSLESGMNMGAWRLRNNTSWTHENYDKYHSNKWSNINTYIGRAIIPFKSQFVAGESSTNNDIYDSVGFRGFRLYSDDAMYPDSLQGFAPTIRGIAKGRSKVIVRQNGYVIYQTYVSPGPFALRDLNPTSSSGDLTVYVEEADGSSQRFVVPYSTVPLLQREGRIKHDLVAGNFRSGNSQQGDPFFVQGTVVAGLKQGFTSYAGTQLASHYRSFTAGMGKNMGNFGAISLDATQANSHLADDSQHQGQSVRFLYAKSLNEYGTTIQLLGYRYSTRGFFTLDDVAYKNVEGYQYGLRDDSHGNKTFSTTSYHNLNYNRKGRYQANINQSIGSYGSLYMSASQQNYWETSQSNKTYQFGYSNTWKGVSYTLSWSTTQSVGLSDTDHSAAFNISVPVSLLLRNKSYGRNNVTDRMYVTSYHTRNSNGNNTWQTGVGGTLLRDNNLSYNIMQGHSSFDSYSGNASAQLQGAYGSASAGYSYTKDSHDYNIQFAGGILAHENGITLSQPLGDTNILVKAPGATGVSIENKTGVATDFRGYTVIPYADIYRINRVALDTNTMNSNTDISVNVKNVIPTRGALVRANFDTHIGVRLLITLMHNNRPVPFGASIREIRKDNSSIVGEGGQAYLSGMPFSGVLHVQWGRGESQQCKASYNIAQTRTPALIYTLKALCR